MKPKRSSLIQGGFEIRMIQEVRKFSEKTEVSFSVEKGCVDDSLSISAETHETDFEISTSESDHSMC